MTAIRISDEFSELKRYKGLVFDMDGTLIDSMRFHVLAWIETAAEFGVSIEESWLYAHGGVPSQVLAGLICEKFGINADLRELTAQKTAAFVRHIPEISIYPRMRILLDTAKALRIPMAIATGTLKSNVEKVFPATGLGAYIDKWVCSQDVTKHKPDPEIFVTAAERIGINPSDCLGFEDAPLGFKSALAAGMDCCVVKDGDVSLSRIVRPNDACDWDEIQKSFG